MSIIRIMGIDPALRNTGLALAEYNTDTQEWGIKSVELTKTAVDQALKKVVRKSSDDLRCAKEMNEAIRQFILIHKVKIAVAEVPTGTQSARGSFSNGVCCGVLAGIQIPLIEVNPSEVKIASCGHKNAAKEEIIEWAVGKWPNAGWLTRKVKGEVKLMNDNEHIADACAAVAAGIATAQFKQAMALMVQMQMTVA